MITFPLFVDVMKGVGFGKADQDIDFLMRVPASPSPASFQFPSTGSSVPPKSAALDGGCLLRLVCKVYIQRPFNTALSSFFLPPPPQARVQDL